MGWIDDYCVYAQNNEAPAAFHWWTGMSVLSSVLKRNVEHFRGYGKIYPPLWILLIGPSGSGKTTALDIGLNILTKIDGVRVLADRGSSEAMAKDLSTADDFGNTEAHGVIYAPELTTFMDRREHNQGMVHFLLRLGDFPDTWNYHTFRGGRIPLKNVAVTFMGATTIDLITEAVPPTALKTGFLARFICVNGYGQERGVVPDPWSDAKLEREVSNSLHELSLLNGRMVMPKRAQEWWIAWYFRHKARFSSEGSERMRAFLERKHVFLLRLAMLVSISSVKRLEFTIDALEEAEKRLDKVELELSMIYEQIEASAVGREQVKLLGFIVAAREGITHSELLRKTALTMLDANSFKKIITLLFDARRISIVKNKQGELVYKRGKNL